jgi:hypothetical protein
MPRSGAPQAVGNSDLDERLTSDAEPPSLTIYLQQQSDWEVHVHALNVAAGPRRPGQIHVRGEIDAGIVQGVERHACQALPTEVARFFLITCPPD